MERQCKHRAAWQAVLATLLICAAFVYGASSVELTQKDRSSQETTVEQGKKTLRLTLEECIAIALDNSHSRRVSRYAVEIAEAQHQQALSSYWPIVKLESAFSRMDEDMVAVTPARVLESQNEAYITAGPGGPDVSGPIYTRVKADVEELTDTLRDRDGIDTSLTMVYPLHTGGKRSAIVSKARYGLEAAREKDKRTIIEVVYDVKRFYFGALLARQVRHIAEEMLARLEVTRDLTEAMYKEGSGMVKKTDYLRTEIILNTTRAIVPLLNRNEQVAKAALANTMGMEWEDCVELAEEEIRFAPCQVDLKQLIGDCYVFNPDVARLEAGLGAAQAGVREARSGNRPTVALFGSVNRIHNSYDYGIVNSQNEKSWVAGLSVQIPIFDGFLTTRKVVEARVRLLKLREEGVLLRKGLALQIKQIFLQMEAAKEQHQAVRNALASAEENRDLITRAYHEGLMETREVIESQIIEAFVKAQYQRILYEHVEAQAHLEFVVGKGVSSALWGTSAVPLSSHE